MVCMWSFKGRGGPEDVRTIIEPELICQRGMKAGVTDLCFLDERSLVASLENGGVVMLQCAYSAEVSITIVYACTMCHRTLTTLYLFFFQPLKQLQVWEALHHLPSGHTMPCTALAVCRGEGGMGVNIVTGGEDGRITVLRTNDLQPLTVIGM